MSSLPAVATITIFAFLALPQCSSGRDYLNRYVLPTHSNFIRSQFYAQSRQKYTRCVHNASICLDPEKNPLGGRTCCWNKFCKDTTLDFHHCGRCGNSCDYGMSCCDGRCVDLNNNKNHCGECQNQCPRDQKCSYGMCEYAGGGYYYVGNRRPKAHQRGPKHR